MARLRTQIDTTCLQRPEVAPVECGDAVPDGNYGPGWPIPRKVSAVTADGYSEIDIIAAMMWRVREWQVTLFGEIYTPTAFYEAGAWGPILDPRNRIEVDTVFTIVECDDSYVALAEPGSEKEGAFSPDASLPPKIIRCALQGTISDVATCTASARRLNDPEDIDSGTVLTEWTGTASLSDCHLVPGPIIIATAVGDEDPSAYLKWLFRFTITVAWTRTTGDIDPSTATQTFTVSTGATNAAFPDLGNLGAEVRYPVWFPGATVGETNAAMFANGSTLMPFEYAPPLASPEPGAVLIPTKVYPYGYDPAHPGDYTTDLRIWDDTGSINATTCPTYADFLATLTHDPE